MNKGDARLGSEHTSNINGGCNAANKRAFVTAARTRKNGRPTVRTSYATGGLQQS
ncbi:MAG: hypothetical protein I8H77_00365 [Comamonadaceae bacterium]|nr:hypothetical protein [Comamonadaceae bacterium]